MTFGKAISKKDKTLNRQHGQFKFDDLSHQIIGCAIDVHNELGPGLLESSYENCLCYELSKMEIEFQRQVSLPIVYKKIRFNCGYTIDILVQDKIIVELKSVENILSVHEAQILTYLKLAKAKIGLLINFNVQQLKNGIKRFVL